MPFPNNVGEDTGNLPLITTSEWEPRTGSVSHTHPASRDLLSACHIARHHTKCEMKPEPSLISECPQGHITGAGQVTWQTKVTVGGSCVRNSSRCWIEV